MTSSSPLKGTSWSTLRCWIVLLALLADPRLSLGSESGANPVRVQQIALLEGWNAIWLEVDPENDAIPATFNPEKVDIVARYFTPQTQVRFIQNPGETAWNEPQWRVWYAPSRAEAFLNSLHAIHGGCAYLVHAKAACNLSVSGSPLLHRLSWNANSYNLAGLPVSGGMSFARFFSGADGKLGGQVYRLVEGSWQKVTNLAGTEIRPGEAYWIYCEGKTNYQGPLEVKFTGADRISVSRDSSLATLDLINRGTSPLTVTASVDGGLPLFRSVPDLANLSSNAVAITGAITLDPIAPGTAGDFRLQFRPAQDSTVSGSALLTLTTSDGSLIRVPIRATNP